MYNCTQNTFGPACHSGFDFTLLFEQIVFSMIPSAVLMLTSLLRLPYLLRQDKKAAWSKWYHIRQVSECVSCVSEPTKPLTQVKVLLAGFAVLQITLLCLWASSPERTKTVIPAACLNVIDALVITLLSRLEFTKSVRPSTVLTVYLFASLWFDAVQLRTLWLLHEKQSLTAIATSSLGIKLMILVMEMRPKRHLLLTSYRNLSLETTAGIFSRVVFWWLNPLLWKGFRSPLNPVDMCQLEPDMHSITLERIFHSSWNSYVRTAQKYKLIRATLWSVRWKILAAIAPRLMQSGFTFTQPFLTFRVIDYVNQEGPGTNDDIGYGLIGATALTYIGLALSSTMYKHKTYQMITQVGGGLISLIYPKTLRLSTTSISDSAAATLMTTDTNTIAQAWTNIHEMWASPIDVGVSVYLLQRKLGFACVAPLVLAIVAILTSGQIAKHLHRRQSLWLAKVQERVSFTSNFLLNLKWLKMVGFSSLEGERMECLRAKEIVKAKSYLRIDTAMNVCANMSTILSPIMVILLYAFTRQNFSGTLTSALVYYALTVVALMSTPLSLALFAFPNFLASLACFNRIQLYLELEERVEYRQFLLPAGISTVSALDSRIINQNLAAKEDGMELTSNMLASNAPQYTSRHIFSIENGSFGYVTRGRPVLKQVC